jgi:APA family basic amino acid/polyamine antiporter
VRYASQVQLTLTTLKVAAIAAVIAIAFAFGAGQTSTFASTRQTVDASTFVWTQLPLGVVAGLFAFGGWHMVTYVAEEAREAARTIPQALIVGVLIVTACYIALNAAYLHLLSPERIAQSNRVAADAADAALGRGGAALMSFVVTVSTFGALNGVILSGPRVYLAMARDRLLMPWAATVHPRFRTPHRAALLQGVWAIVLLWTGSYRALFTRVVYTEWIFFALMAWGLVRLRQRATYSPRYRVWGYPVTPGLFIVGSLYVVGTQIAHHPTDSAFGLLFVLAGLPVYLIWLRRSPIQAAAVPEVD